MNDLISIIIPVYNCEAYLRDCVASILCQTYPYFELILVDGGGKDKSGAICDELAATDKRIKVIHKANEGVSIARNRGIELSSGKWLAFIDSDDTITPDYLEKLHQLTIQEPEANLFLCNMSDIYGDGIPRKRSISRNLTGLLKQDYLPLHQLLIGPVIKLYKRSLVIEKSICFPAGISCGEDELFNFQYYRYVDKYAFLDEGLYHYYHRPNDSLSQHQSLRVYQGMVAKLQVEEQFYQEMDIQEAEAILAESTALIKKNYTQYSRSL